MASPDNSPVRNLRGASRTTGGVLRGHAQGNTGNLADFNDTPLEPISFMPVDMSGCVRVYQSRNEVDTGKPSMVFHHEVTPTIGPVLTTLADLYSPIKSEYVYFLTSF